MKYNRTFHTLIHFVGGLMFRTSFVRLSYNFYEKL